MSELTIARRYAKSFLDLAGEQKKVDQIIADTRVLQSAMDSRDLVLLLQSPIIKAEKKLSALRAVFSGKLDELTIKFIDLVTTKGREGMLSSILGAVIDQYNAMNNIASAELTTAVQVDDSTVESIKSQLEFGDQKLEIETTVNPDILGGYILEIGDEVYDASVKRQLSNLRKELTNG